MSIFVFLSLRGNAGAMKIPTAFSDNTSPKVLIYLASAKPNSALSHGNSTSGLERPCNIRHQQRNLRPVLRPPVEITPQTSRTNQTRIFCDKADQYHVGSHRADHGPKHETGEDLIVKGHKITAFENLRLALSKRDRRGETATVDTFPSSIYF